MKVLSERFGVSLGVVREALTTLAGQGLVQAEPQLGFAVASISPKHLEDLTEARVDIEGRALRRAIERGDLAWEAALVSAGHTLRNTLLARDGEPEAQARHLAFHEALIAGCGNPVVIEIVRGLQTTAMLYRRLSPPDLGSRDIRAEHDSLLDAALRREPDNAVALLTDHLRLTCKATIDAWPYRETTEAAKPVSRVGSRRSVAADD